MDAICFGPKILLYQKLLLDHKLFLTQNFFLTQNLFLPQNMFPPKKISDPWFLELIFFFPNFFCIEIFMDPKIFWTQNFFDAKLFWDTTHFFYPKWTWEWSLTFHWQLCHPWLLLKYMNSNWHQFNPIKPPLILFFTHRLSFAHWTFWHTMTSFRTELYRDSTFLISHYFVVVL